VYYASAPARPALSRAIAALEARELLSVVPLDAVEVELAQAPGGR
jgi:hypothetical protein